MKIFKKIVCAFKEHVLKWEKSYTATSAIDVYKCERCGKKFYTGKITDYYLFPLKKSDENYCDQKENELKMLSYTLDGDLNSINELLKSLFTSEEDSYVLPFTEEERLEMKKMYENEKHEDDDNT